MPLDLARGRARVIAVNNSWRLVPWADALFGTDGIWWVDHRGVPDFKGRRFTSSPYAQKMFGLELFAPAGHSSGLRAVYLAERLQANPILLVGFEMHLGNGVHWHEPHCGRLRNPGKSEMMVWRTDMELAAGKIAKRGTRVINCTPGTALRCFPCMPLSDALDGC